MSRKKVPGNGEPRCQSCLGTKTGRRGVAGPLPSNDEGACSKGLAHLLSDMPFDVTIPRSLGCPLCGERVRLRKGVCPSCHEPIFVDTPGSRWDKVSPVVSADGIVFLHFDVESGEMSYLQGGSGKFGVERVMLISDAQELPELGYPMGQDASDMMDGE